MAAELLVLPEAAEQDALDLGVGVERVGAGDAADASAASLIGSKLPTAQLSPLIASAYRCGIRS